MNLLATLRRLVLGLTGVFALVLLLVGYWMLRANASEVEPHLGLESWTAVSDGMHNSNTDLIFWRGHYYLIHARSPYHFGSPDCQLVLWRSEDARIWEELRRYSVAGEDIRDPKFAAIGDRLLLYAAPNKVFEPRPYTTVVSSTEDGEHWSGFVEVDPGGWVFWRPKSRDGRTWYVPAYISGMGEVSLFASEDGRRWREVSVIHDEDGASETGVEFLPDGRLLATVRLEYETRWFGNAKAATMVAVAEAPYEDWKRTRSEVDRLDGPCLFAHAGRIYAVARRDPGPAAGWINRRASIFTRKRTALYLLEPERVVLLSDLPSAGDTSYAGCVAREGALVTSYYTSDATRDWPWILGMVRASEIRMARVPLDRLAAVADRAARRARFEAPPPTAARPSTRLPAPEFTEE